MGVGRGGEFYCWVWGGEVGLLVGVGRGGEFYWWVCAAEVSFIGECVQRRWVCLWVG